MIHLDTETVNNVTVVKIFDVINMMQNASVDEIVGKINGTTPIICKTNGNEPITN